MWYRGSWCCDWVWNIENLRYIHIWTIAVDDIKSCPIFYVCEWDVSLKERSKCDLFQSRLIQAPLPLDPVLGNNPRDPRVMLHNVAAPRTPAPDLQAIINLNKTALHDIVRTNKKLLERIKNIYNTVRRSCNSTLFKSLKHILMLYFVIILRSLISFKRSMFI